MSSFSAKTDTAAVKPTLSANQKLRLGNIDVMIHATPFTLETTLELRLCHHGILLSMLSELGYDTIAEYFEAQLLQMCHAAPRKGGRVCLPDLRTLRLLNTACAVKPAFSPFKRI